MSTLAQRWRSRQLIGDNKHVLIVRVREAFMNRGYMDTNRIDTGEPIYPPLIWNANNLHAFRCQWVPLGPWMTLPHVESAKWSRSVDLQTGGQRGGSTLTVVMDNIEFPDTAGAAGTYHTFDRGYYSPTRGYQPMLRPTMFLDPRNSWGDVLNTGQQIEVWEGYGTGADVELLTFLDPTTNSYAPPSGALNRTWTGVIVNLDSEANPDHLTITAQDFSIFLTDQRLVEHNKAPEIPSPVTFADLHQSWDRTAVAGGTYYYSPGTPSQFLFGGWWRSQGFSTRNPSPAPWVEMVLPAGYYEDFGITIEAYPYVTQSSRNEMTLNAVEVSQKMAISLWIPDNTGIMDGTEPLPAGWVDLTGDGSGWAGMVDTIGDGPIPYMFTLTQTIDFVEWWSAVDWKFTHHFHLPEGSRLRVTCTDLGLGNKTPGVYRAALDSLMAFVYNSNPVRQPPPGNVDGWVLVEDMSEVVKMILIWAGFQEWKIDWVGWSLFQPRIYGIDKFLMDVISDMLSQGAFIWYMGQPTNDDRSIGVPHFEYISALNSPGHEMIEVRDTDMTEALTTTWKLSNLPHQIIYRGDMTQAGSTLPGFGVEGQTTRYQARYYPPWSAQTSPLDFLTGMVLYSSTIRPGGDAQFGGLRRDASIIRMVTETMGNSVETQLESDAACLFACVLAGLQYALDMGTAQFQIPGIAPLDLNAQVAVVDRASALNSRIWVSSIESEHTNGPDGRWHMTMGGSVIDNQDMDSLRADYNYAYKQCVQVRNTGPVRVQSGFGTNDSTGPGNIPLEQSGAVW